MQINPFGDKKPYNMLATKISARMESKGRAHLRFDLQIKEKIDKSVPQPLIQYILMKSAQEQINDCVGRMERFLAEKGIDTKLFLTCVNKDYRGPLSVDDLIKDILRKERP